MNLTVATELWRMSAREMAEAIRSRQVSSQEVIEAHLQRIEAVNGSINAVVIVLDEQALEAARAADRAVTGGADLGPFHGVPFTVKENIDVAGTATTQGLEGAGQRLSASRRSRRRASQGSWGHPDRPHEPSQRRHPLALRERAVGSDGESLGPFSNSGRLERRRGCR